MRTCSVGWSLARTGPSYRMKTTASPWSMNLTSSLDSRYSIIHGRPPRCMNTAYISSLRVTFPPRIARWRRKEPYEHSRARQNMPNSRGYYQGDSSPETLSRSIRSALYQCKFSFLPDLMARNLGPVSKVFTQVYLLLEDSHERYISQVHKSVQDLCGWLMSLADRRSKQTRLFVSNRRRCLY